MEVASSGESDSDCGSEIGSVGSELSGSNDAGSEPDFSDSEEGNNSSEEDKQLHFPKLSNSKRNSEMSFEDLIKIRDHMGTKKFNQEILTPNGKSSDSKKTKKNFKRENRNRPQEISSKQKVPFLRQVIKTSKAKQMRDPRFDDLCGSEYNEEIFNKRYQFLDGIKRREKRQLEKVLKKTKSTSTKGEVQYLLTRMKQQAASKEQRAKIRETQREWKKVEKKKVKQDGKKPYFLKESDKKILLNNVLKKNDNLEKTEGKKQKKLKSKESKIMPYERRTLNS